MTFSSDRLSRAVVWLAFSVSVALAGLLIVSPSSAGAVEHPPIDVTEVNMVPERGWGVSGQTPQNTQTETLDVLVWDMVQSGDKMFVGGAFLNVQNGRDATPIRQSYLAAFDVATGEWVDTFRPTFDRAIYALEVLPNGSLLVGGEFEQVNGGTRRGLVALNPDTGEIDPAFEGAVDRPWSSRRATIRDMKVEPGSGYIYVAGNFSHLDGAGGSRTTVSKAGRFLNDKGVLDAAWKPAVSGGAVWGLDTDPSRGEVVMSGWFTSINGRSGTGHFEVVDDRTGAYVAGKKELVKNDGGAQPETFDVVYGEGIVLMIGEQHMIQVLDSDDHTMLGYHGTGFADGFQWRGYFAGGAYQAGELIGDVIIAGCHCTSGGDNHYESFTQRRTSRYNVMAYDAKTGRHIEGFNADVDSPRDGHWAAASDTNGCLWVGGDYHVGGNENGSPRWLGGFARMCTPIPPIIVTDPGDQTGQVGDTVSIQIDASGGRNATFRYTASGLPSGLTIDSGTGLITGTIDKIGFSTATITVEAIAGEGRTGTRVFDWAIMDGEAPNLEPVDRRAVFSGQPTELLLSASDTEKSPLSWTAAGLPAGLVINPATGAITDDRQAGPSPVGLYTVAVTVTDLIGLSDTESFTLRVIESPVVDAIASFTGFGTNRGSYYLGWQFTVDEPTVVSQLGAFDADQDGRITNNGATTAGLYSVANRQTLAQVDIPADAPVENGSAYATLPNPVTLEPGNTYIVAAEVSGEPYARYTGTLVTAPGVNYVGGAYKFGSDPGYPSSLWNGSNSFMGGTFRIQGESPIPTLAPVADQVASTGDPQSLALTADNPGGGALAWSAAGLPDGLAIDTATGVIAGVPTTTGVFTVVVTVADVDNFTDNQSFTWTVVDSVPPVLNSIADQTFEQFSDLSISSSVVDPEAGLVWSAAGLAPGTTIDSATGTISGRATKNGVFTVTVTVTDLVGLSDTESFTITVIERATTPAVASFTGFAVRQGTYFLGYQFQVDREMLVTEFGVHDADRNGQITNQGDSTVALWDTADRRLIAQIDVPAAAPVEDHFAYAPLEEPVKLVPGVNYMFASEVSGEPFAERGNLILAPGITYTGYGWNAGASPIYPPNRGNWNINQYFGPGFRFADPAAGGGGGGPVDDDSLVPTGSDWRYDDSGIDLGDAWATTAFDDAAWPSASAEFGFGDDDETTTWTPGSVTYYARSQFEFTGNKPASLQLDMKADDGAVVYLNGVEVLRDNMPDGPIDASTPAQTWRAGVDEDFKTHLVSSAPLIEGTNLIAVEVHNAWAGNNDLSFDLRLRPSDQGGAVQPPVELVQAGAQWAHVDSADGQPAGWPGALAGAPTGPAEFGFGDDDETTVLTRGQDVYYFSRGFEVANPDRFTDLTLGLAADDGAVVYLNGVEVHRFNMPDGVITPATRPVTWVAGADELFKTTTITSDALQVGTNTISVEVHNLWPGNNDLTFDLYLTDE